MNLTDRTIRGLKPKTNSYRVADSALRGLNLKIQPSGRKVWILRYTYSGKTKFHKLGEYPEMSLSEARDAARDTKARLAAGNGQQAANWGTVEQLLTGYWEDMRDSGKTSWVQVRDRLKNDVIPILGDRTARDITEDDINQVLAAIYNRGARVLTNRVRSYLQTAWRWGRAHDRDYRQQGSGIRFGLPYNPVTEIPRDTAAERAVDRVLDWGEIRRIWHANEELEENGDPVISRVFVLQARLILATGGQRPQEITGIHKREIDRTNAVLILPPDRVKNRTTHVVPLTAMALEIIAEAEDLAGESKYLFPGRYDEKKPVHHESLRNAFTAYCLRKDHEMAPWTPRDLRRTAKTRMGEVGISKELRDRIQNHAKSDVSSLHYDYWDYVPQKREALEQWEEQLLVRVVHPLQDD